MSKLFSLKPIEVANWRQRIGTTLLLALCMILLRYLILYSYSRIGALLNIVVVPSKSIKVASFYVFLSSVVLFPVLEELIFRLPLKFGKLNLRLSLISIAIYLMLIFSIQLLKLNLISLIVIVGVVALYEVLILLLKASYLERLHLFLCDNFKWFLSVTVFLFSLAHLNRFDLASSSPVVVVVIMTVIGFGLIGILFSYVRIKLGIVMAIVFHSIYNLLSFTEINSSQKYNEYRIEVDSLQNVIDSLNRN